jgi:enamine deaminase RidA (YjgF/YER057c/UK114 family)
MTWYITDRQEYQANLEGMGRVYREMMGSHFPAMAMVQVAALIEEDAKVEVETTAVVPTGG